MFAKIRKWIIKQKIINFFSWKKSNQRKVKSLLNKKINYSHVINELNKEFLIKVFSLQDLENIIYSSYEKSLFQELSIILQKIKRVDEKNSNSLDYNLCQIDESNEEKVNKTFEVFNLEPNEELINIIKKKFRKKIDLEITKKQQGIFRKIIKLFFPCCKSQIERKYLVEFHELNEIQRKIFQTQNLKWQEFFNNQITENNICDLSDENLEKFANENKAEYQKIICCLSGEDLKKITEKITNINDKEKIPSPENTSQCCSKIDSDLIVNQETDIECKTKTGKTHDTSKEAVNNIEYLNF